MADSEVRQKFEAPGGTPDAFEQAWKEFNSGGIASGWGMVAFTSGFGKGFAAGMRAGEIAQREFVIDLLGERIRRILEVGRAENDGEDYGQSHCFHLMEVQRILRGEKTCGVYDDYGMGRARGGEMNNDLSTQYWSDLSLAASCCASDLCKDALVDGGAGLDPNNSFEATAILERWMMWIVARSKLHPVTKCRKVSEKVLAQRAQKFRKAAQASQVRDR